MRVAQLGDGEPDIAIVGGIHGDEPCGVRAIERILDDDPSVARSVKLIVANEKALEQGVRYLDADLNRAFDEGAPPDAHERALAERLKAEIEDMTVMSIHSTQSYRNPFAIASDVGPTIESIVPHLTVDALVDAGLTVNGRIFEAEADIVEVEAGHQGSEAAAENAYTLSREFLTATGVMPGDTVPKSVPVFELGAPIEKPPASAYEVFADNFTRVDPGDQFAAADETPITAEEPFWPVLLSAYGYRDIFGYESQKTGHLVPN